jgi:hypothetical protein
LNNNFGLNYQPFDCRNIVNKATQDAHKSPNLMARSNRDMSKARVNIVHNRILNNKPFMDIEHIFRVSQKYSGLF